MDNKLDIRKGPPGTEQRVFLEGRLDASWAGHLDDYLNSLVREGSYRLIINMSGVQYLSSAGIRILVSQYKKVKKIGGLFVLEELSEQVSEVLKMVGMINILTEDALEVAPVEKEKSRTAEVGGYRFEQESLSDQPMTIQLLGNPGLSLNSGYTGTDNHKIKFPGTRYGLGIGAIGLGYEDCKGRFGEFLALGDALVYKPSDGSKVPDYTVKAGMLEPEINALNAIQADGNFSHLVTFDPLESGGTIALSDLASGFAESTGLDKFVFLLIAESAGLVGVSLSAPPVGGNLLFDFPGIRENINFTTEPAYSRMLTVSFGVFSNEPEGQLKTFLRPVKPGSAAGIHMHTAVFPFQALSKQETSAGKLILHLFETSIVEDVLHLVNDSREIAGLGESAFKQGVAWIGKFNNQ
jgi:anti-anti-sigma factor